MLFLGGWSGATSCRVWFQSLANFIHHDFVRVRRNAAMAHSGILIGEEVAEENLRDIYRLQMPHEAGHSGLDRGIGPIITNTIAVTEEAQEMLRSGSAPRVSCSNDAGNETEYT